MKQIIRQTWMGFALLTALLSGTPVATAEEGRNLNFAAFHKVSADFEFEPIVLGKFSDFIATMEGSQILILSHTAASVSGDVINIQQDVLRQSSHGLGDVGINCQLSYVAEGSGEDTIFEIGGLCKILDVSENSESKLMAIIPMTGLPDTTQGIDAWVLLHEDEASGIAFYANVSH